MKREGKIRYLITSSHTSRGFYTFIPELLDGLKKVYILKGAPGTGKATFIRMLGESMYKQGYEIEFWISAMEVLSPDGVYIPLLECAVVNGSLPQAIDPKYPGIRDDIIYFHEFWNKEEIGKQQEGIIALFNNIEDHRLNSLRYLQDARDLKVNLREEYKNFLNWENLKKKMEELSNQIFAEPGGEKHYFATALTPDGLVNYVEELSSECSKRYIFKGFTGSSKNLVIDELADRARKKGHFVEYYHCGLEVENLIMLIIKNLQLAVIADENIDIQARPWDITIVMNDYLDGDFDAESIQTSEVHRNLEALIIKAKQEMENAGNSLKDIKKIYAKTMDFDMLNKKRQEIETELKRS